LPKYLLFIFSMQHAIDKQGLAVRLFGSSPGSTIYWPYENLGEIPYPCVPLSHPYNGNESRTSLQGCQEDSVGARRSYHFMCFLFFIIMLILFLFLGVYRVLAIQ
jgi:hypothetical protein